MPPAARVMDRHSCSHRGGPIMKGQDSVIICGRPAARAGDPAFCDSPRDVISMGEPSVFIGGKMAARMGDPTAHGGVITGGAHCVLIGSSPKGQCPKDAAKMRAAFIKGMPVGEARGSKQMLLAQNDRGGATGTATATDALPAMGSGNAVTDAARRHFPAYAGNCSGFVRAGGG
jgi:uncharacterized Zn-binding protein involved in type VI secretion